MLKLAPGDGDVWVFRSEGVHLRMEHPLELEAGGRDVAGAATSIAREPSAASVIGWSGPWTRIRSSTS